MRIVVHTINYRPELTGIGKYTTEMCEWLVAQGHEVTVIAPPPYYPQWRVPPGYRQWLYGKATEQGVRVWRAPLWLPRRPGGMSRIVYALSFAISSFPLLLLAAIRRPHLVMTIQPSFLNSPGAWLAARFCGARTWLHVQDFEIDLAYDLGQLKKGRSIVSAIESWMLRRFDLVSAISKRMLERAQAKRAHPEKLFLLPNWVDSDSIFPNQAPSPFRESLGIPAGSQVALFAGSLGAKHGIEMILEAARQLSDLPVHFVISGEGVAKADLHAGAAGLSNVHFLPLQPLSKLNDLLNLADIHLLPQRKGAADSVFPSKLIGMLASGRPVVAMAQAGSEVATITQGCGICVNHGDIDAFAKAIRHLLLDSEARHQMGRAARSRALDRFRQDLVLAHMESQLLLENRVPWDASLLANSDPVHPL